MISEKGSISATLTIIVVIIIGVVITCVIPLANTATKADNMSQVALQSALTDFANEACNKGSVNEKDFAKLIEKVTGPNTYNMEIEVYELGENPGKKNSQAVSKKIGENVYTIYYTSQVEKIWDENNGKFELEAGDQVHVYAMNTNTTMGTELTAPSSSDIANIVAEATATCNK